jgi:hypothetical protein
MRFAASIWRDATASLAQRGDKMRQPVFFARDFQPAFGGPLFALFGHDANCVWLVAQCDCLHFIGGCHFEIQRNGQDLLQAFDVSIGNVATIFAKMRGNTVCACFLGRARGTQWIRISPAACVSYRGDMVNIDPKSQLILRCHDLFPSEPPALQHVSLRL